MKRTTQILTVLILALFLVPSAFAANGLRKIPIHTCTGSGDLYVYQGDQLQEPDTSFQVDNDELLIFTKSNRVHAITVDGVSPEVIYDQDSPFHVKIYRKDVTPGQTVSIDATTDSQNARGIQAYFVQDASDPVYNVADLGVTYDGDEPNTVYLKPGTYQYVFFDKYDKRTSDRDDSRKLTVKVTDPSGHVTSTTYTKPNPVGTQGTVVHEFTATEEGYYKVEVSTEDSIWWNLFDCQPNLDDFCKNADAVIPVDLSVVGDGCHWSGKITDSEDINIAQTDEYYMTGIVKRGNPGQCQTKEEFYLNIEGQQGPVAKDDADPCAMTVEEQYVGTFNLDKGIQTVNMYTAAKCPPDQTANSVEVTALCLYNGSNDVPEFGFVGAIIAVVAVGGFVIFRKRT